MPRSPSRPPSLGPENNLGGARWCTEHGDIASKKHGGRWDCSKRKRNREPCHGPAIRGMDACRKHVGMSKEVAMARGEAKITAWSHFGDATKTVAPGLAVLSVLQMSWLRLAAYSTLLKEQAEQAAERIDTEDLLDAGLSVTSGIIGHRYGAAGKEGHIFAQAEEVRALVTLEAAERDRVVKYAKVAHDMGINDRLTNLAERWGDVIATRVTNILDGLDLSPEQLRRVPVLVQSHLGSIDVDDAMEKDG